MNTVNFYKVTGRYMDGSKVTFYHLMGKDGSQNKVNKERIIYMIGKGMIENMRIQSLGKDDLIIRGKGVDLNKLPIYDENKQEIRGRKNSNTEVSGQYKVTKRIMFNKSCIGYMVEDVNGNEKKFSTEQVTRLTSEKLITNMKLGRYTPKGSTETKLVLQGNDIEIKKLPILIVNEQGKIVDPTKNISGLTFRAVRMKRGGVLYNNSNKESKTFDNGDYIVCKANGSLDIENGTEWDLKYKINHSNNIATCDNCNNEANYTIEIYGGSKITIGHNEISKWAIVENA